MNEKENMLVGFDICKLLENACNEVLKPPYTDRHDDEEQWREAYDKGIADAISLLKQLIEHALIDDTECCNYVIAHVPELTTMTEFASLDEIMSR